MKSIIRFDFIRVLALGLSLVVYSSSSYADEKNEVVVEIVHWWNSSGELAAVDEITKALEEQGAKVEITRKKNYSDFRSAVINNISFGYLPAVTHWLAGEELLKLGGQDVIKPIPEIINGEKVSDILFQEAIDDSMIDSQLMAIPIGIHIQNTAYYNAKIYDQLGLKLPRHWDDFIKDAETIRNAGFVPIALSNEPWQIRNILDGILVDKGGSDAFLHFYDSKKNISDIKPVLISAYDTLIKLRNLSNRKHEENLWVENTKLLSDNKVAAYFLGDYVNGELVSATGLIPGKDFYCDLSPGNEGVYIYGIDAFAFMNIEDPVLISGQKLLVETLLKPKIQQAYNSKKGGIPVRKDINPGALDACSAKMYEGWLKSTSLHLPYPGGYSRARLSLFQNIGVELWNQSEPDIQAAVDKLIAAVDKALEN